MVERLPHEGTCPGFRFATANVALGDTPVWPRRQRAVQHAHPVYMLEFLKSGEMSFGGAPHPPVAMTAHMYYIMPPGLPHSHEVCDDISTIHVALRPEFVRRYVTQATGQSGEGVPVFPGPVCSASPAVESLLRRMVREARQEAPWRPLLVDTLAVELIIQLMQDHGVVTPPAQAEETDGISRAIEMILTRHREDLRLDVLAAEARLSRYHFLRTFKERVGTTPSAYLRQIRIEHAAALLRSTDLPITAIAEEVGFGGPNRLSEAIRESYGLSPTALRNAP